MTLGWRWQGPITGICPHPLVQLMLVAGKYHKNPKIKIWTREKIADIIIKFEQCDFTIELYVKKGADGMANSVDPDEIEPVHIKRVLTTVNMKAQASLHICTVSPDLSLFAQTTQLELQKSAKWKIQYEMNLWSTCLHSLSASKKNIFRKPRTCVYEGRDGAEGGVGRALQLKKDNNCFLFSRFRVLRIEGWYTETSSYFMNLVFDFYSFSGFKKISMWITWSYEFFNVLNYLFSGLKRQWEIHKML